MNCWLNVQGACAYRIYRVIDIRYESNNLALKILKLDVRILTLFRMEEGGKKPPPPSTSFSQVTSTNVGISPQNFLNPKTFQILALIAFPHWCKISSLYLMPIQNYWTWTKSTPQKSSFSGQILIKLRLWCLS